MLKYIKIMYCPNLSNIENKIFNRFMICKK